MQSDIKGKGIFITGTDTGVGKTIVTACLAASLMRAGKTVAVYKPVQCGDLLKGKIKSSDLAKVKKLSGLQDSALVNDFSFAMPASPHLAAERESKRINIKIIKEHYKSLLKGYEYVLVEGAGGLVVPLTRNYTILDLIKDLSIPVLVVARSSLGTINHTSLTLNFLKHLNIPVVGVVINYYKSSLIEKDNKKIIRRLNNVPIIGVVPFSKNIENLSDNFEKYIDMKRF